MFCNVLLSLHLRSLNSLSTLSQRKSTPPKNIGSIEGKIAHKSTTISKNSSLLIYFASSDV